MSGELTGMSVEEIKEFVDSPKEKAELSDFIDDVYTNTAAEPDVSIFDELERCYEKTVIRFFREIQELVDDGGGGSKFCFHDVVAVEAEIWRLAEKYRFAALQPHANIKLYAPR